MAITMQVEVSKAGQPNVKPVEFQGASHWVETVYEGCVLDTLEHNHYDDSDFDAIVWDAETGTIKTIEYGTTRFWTYLNRAWIDATEEVREQAAIVNEAGWLKATRTWAQRDAEKVKVGRVVEVVKGRKIAHGLKGTVLVYTKSKFSTKWAEKFSVKLQLEDGQVVWTDAENVKVASPADYMPSEEEMAAQAHSRRYDFRSLHSY